MKKLLIFAILFSTLSCSDYVDDAFLNPNAKTTAEPGEVLAAVQANIARGYQFDSRMLGRYVQNWTLTTAASSWDRMGYDANSDNGGEKWRSHYWTSGLNVLNMITDGTAAGKIEYAGVGNTIMAHGWLTLTDYHGEVILKEAFNTSALTFKFDTQEEAYLKVIELCDLAITQLNQAIAKGAPSADFVKADEWMNKGDLQKWLKYAYGIKAKVLHRYSLKSNYKPDDVISAVNSSLSSHVDDVMINFENNPISSASANFFGPLRNNLAAYRPTDLTIRYMNGTIFPGAVDPRLAYIFRPSTDGMFRGIRTAIGEPTSVPAAQRTNNFFGFPVTGAPVGGIDTLARTYFKNRSPFPVLTYAELQFIKAEAAFIKGDKPTALDAYRKGIRGNIDALNLHFTGYKAMSTTDINAFISAVVPASANALTLSSIMVQKYVALWGYGFEETWVDLRRHAYSQEVYPTFELPTSLFPDNGGLPAQRVRPRYNSEYLWNFAELQRISADKANYHTIPVWFSTK